MSRLIDADRRITVTYYDEEHEEWSQKTSTIWDTILEVGDEIPPVVDAIPVIQCRDCIWYEIAQLKKDGAEDRRYKPSYCSFWDKYFEPDWFCAEGERREEE